MTKKMNKRAYVRHGDSKVNKMTGKQEQTKLYRVWHHMLEQGGRCKEWDRSYPAFKEWAVKNGFDEETGLIHFRRMDTTKPFGPNNTLITSAFQPNATYLTLNGITMNMNQWAKHLGFSKQMLRARVASGRSIEECLLTPKHKLANVIDIKAD